MKVGIKEGLAVKIEAQGTRMVDSARQVAKRLQDVTRLTTEEVNEGRELVRQARSITLSVCAAPMIRWL